MILCNLFELVKNKPNEKKSNMLLLTDIALISKRKENIKVFRMLKKPDDEKYE
jgi:preprotein translocase subunit Sss1